MKLTLKQQDLVRELKLAAGATERKSTIPALAHVLLEASGDSLRITATDLELGFRTSCDATVSRSGAATVPLNRLLGYASLLPPAELAISSTASDSISISCGSARTRIAGLDPESYPKLSDLPDEWDRIAATSLAAAIKRTIISVAGKESHYTLAGALLVIRDGSVGLASTDGHRLSVYFENEDRSDGGEEAETLMPKRAMAELQKILALAEGSEEEPAMVDFAKDKHNMFFRSGRRLLISRRLTGKFPDYKRVMPRELMISLELDGDTLGRVLGRVAQFADERSRVVRFDLEDGRLKMTASVSDFGSSEEALLVDYEGDPFTVGFNAQYIIEFLNVCESGKVLLRLSDPRSAAQLEVPGLPRETDYRYVIMPIRV